MSTPESVKHWGWFEGLPLQTQDVDGTDRIVLAREFFFRARCLGYRRCLVAEGLESDGLSRPRWTWSLIGHPYRGPGKPAGFAHDELYSAHEVTILDLLGDLIEIRPITRRQADRVLYELLRARGMTWRRAAAHYLVVHWFGRKHW